MTGEINKSTRALCSIALLTLVLCGYWTHNRLTKLPREHWQKVSVPDKEVHVCRNGEFLPTPIHTSKLKTKYVSGYSKYLCSFPPISRPMLFSHGIHSNGNNKYHPKNFTPVPESSSPTISSAWPFLDSAVIDFFSNVMLIPWNSAGQSTCHILIAILMIIPSFVESSPECISYNVQTLLSNPFFFAYWEERKKKRRHSIKRGPVEKFIE
jgi:hypothetical protein